MEACSPHKGSSTLVKNLFGCLPELQTLEINQNTLALSVSVMHTEKTHAYVYHQRFVACLFPQELSLVAVKKHFRKYPSDDRHHRPKPLLPLFDLTWLQSRVCGLSDKLIYTTARPVYRHSSAHLGAAIVITF